jgi:hypothetical protein
MSLIYINCPPYSIRDSTPRLFELQEKKATKITVIRHLSQFCIDMYTPTQTKRAQAHMFLRKQHMFLQTSLSKSTFFDLSCSQVDA